VSIHAVARPIGEKAPQDKKVRKKNHSQGVGRGVSRCFFGLNSWEAKRREKGLVPGGRGEA